MGAPSPFSKKKLDQYLQAKKSEKSLKGKKQTPEGTIKQSKSPATLDQYLQKRSKKGFNTEKQPPHAAEDEITESEYAEISLPRSEVQTLRDLEHLYKQSLPFFSDSLPHNAFGFAVHDHHVRVLALTKYTLQGFIPIRALPDSLGNLKYLERLEVKLTRI